MSTADLRHRILALALQRGALLYGDFTLTSGKKSRYYFDGRLLTLDPEGSTLVAQAMLPGVVAAGASAVGGPATGGIPLVAAIVVVSQERGTPVSGFFVRAEAKGHGRGKQVEGVLPQGAPVAVVDDVCTTAGSLFRAIRAAEEAGCRVVRVACILDRKEGGSDELRRQGYDFEALLEATPEGEVRVVESRT